MQRKKLLANIHFDDNYEIEEYGYLHKPLLDIIDIRGLFQNQPPIGW